MADENTRIETEKIITELMQKQKDLSEQIVEEQKKLEILQSKQKKTFDDELSIVEKTLSIETKKRELREERLRKSIAIKKEKLEQKDLSDKQREILTKNLDTLKDIYDANEKITKDLESQNQATKEIVSGTESWARATFGVSKELSFIEKLYKTPGGIRTMAATIGNTLTPMNVLRSTFSKVVESSVYWGKQFESAASNIAETTGQGRAMAEMAWDASFGMAQMGVDLEKTSEAVKTLTADIVGFNFYSEKQQKQMVQTSGLFQSLGISASTASGMMAFLTKSLGHSADETTKISKEIVAAGMSLGKQPAVIAEEFAAVAPQLAGYGKRAVGVFNELQAIASATSVSLQSLVSIAEQFETFEGAATAAGRLNAVLGGGLLNSIDLLTASAPEKIRMVMEAVESSGRNWENLDRFERKAIAAAAGIENLDEANRLFKGGLSGYDEAQKKMAAMTDANEKLNEAAKAAQPLWNDLKLLTAQLAVAVKPVISILKSATSTLIGWLDWLNKKDPWLATAAAIASITIGLIGLGQVMKLFGGFSKVATSGIRVFTGALEGGIKTAGTAAKEVASTAFDIVKGIASVIESIAKAIGNSIGFIGKGIGTALKFIGAGAKAAAPGLLQLGGSLIAIGAGVALTVTPFALLAAAIGYAAGEIGFLVNSLKELFVTVDPASVGIIALALTGLTASLIAFAAGMNAVGVLAASPFFVIGIATFVAALYSIKTIIDSIGGERLASFQVSMTGFGDVLEGIKGLEREKVKLASELAIAGADYHRAKAGATSDDTFAKAIDSLTKAVSGIGAGTGEGTGTKVEVYIDGKVLDKRYVTHKELKNAVRG